MNDIVDPQAIAENFGAITTGTESKQEVDEFRGEVGSKEFLKRIQLIAPNAKLAPPGGSCTIGNFYLVGQGDPVDLGEEVDIVICAYRFKALRWNKETAEESFEKESDLYLEIQADADAGKSMSKGDPWDYSWGPEFLVWISDLGEFAHYYMGGKSARRSAAEQLYPLWKDKDESVSNQTIGRKWYKGRYNSWYLHLARACSTDPANIPTQVDLEKQVELFLNPPVKEEVEQSDTADR